MIKCCQFIVADVVDLLYEFDFHLHVPCITEAHAHVFVHVNRFLDLRGTHSFSEVWGAAHGVALSVSNGDFTG